MRRRSPLEGWATRLAAVSPTVRVVEIPFAGQVNLRLAGVEGAVVDGAVVDGAVVEPEAAIAAVLGADLPVVPGTSVVSGEIRVLWLGPDEWLVVAPDAGGTPDALVASLRDAIGTARGAVTDVSAQRTVVSLSGPGARGLLAKGCSIDFHPTVSPVGTCVQTLLAQSGITIVVADDTGSDFLLLVRASFAEYVAAWIIDAARDLDVSIS